MNKILFYALPVVILSNVLWASEKTYELKQDFTPVVKEGHAELWIPVPMEMPAYQKLVASESFPNSNADSVVVQQVGPVRLVHAVWNNAVNPQLHVVSVISLQDHLSLSPDSDNVDVFLQPTQHVQTDGIVLKTAQDIVGSLQDDDLKAKAIYNWIVQKTLRDKSVRGCGRGDVKATLLIDNLRGKCADLNSLFVGLARAAGIPARDVFGIRVDASQEFPSLGHIGDVTKSQHCRAEYYSSHLKAWVPVDPADVRKAILEEKLTLEDPRIENLRQKFFGFWEGNWVAFNDARDFAIPTSQNSIPVNYFMYPLLVSAAASPDGMDPTEVSYHLTSRLLPASDSK